MTPEQIEARKSNAQSLVILLPDGFERDDALKDIALCELAEDGMRLIWFLSRRDSTDGIVKMMLRQIEGDYPSMDEWRTAIDAARAKEGKS
jgi:hypothetical protein